MDGFSPLVILRKVLQRIPFHPFDVNCLDCMQYEGIPCAGESASVGANIELRHATHSDIEALAACQGTPDEFVRRFDAKDHCILAIIDGQIVGYQWFCSKPSYLEERYRYKVEISSDSIYGYDAFVLPKYRRAKVWTQIHVTYLRDLMLQSRRHKILVMVDRGNSVSMNAHLRFGYRTYRNVYVVKAFGKSLCIKKAIRTNESDVRPTASGDAFATH